MIKWLQRQKMYMSAPTAVMKVPSGMAAVRAVVNGIQ